MSRFLVFDCETTGLPLRRNITYRDVEAWPRLVQLAWAVYDPFGERASLESHIVRPGGFRIPAESSLIHGISHERALAEGQDVRVVLERLDEALREPLAAVIAHNFDFDSGVIGAELLRTGFEVRLFERPILCTMKTTTSLLKLPGPYGFKWPKLEELYDFLFGGAYEGAHDAGRDVEATARCFFELRRRGHYPVE